MRRCRPALRIPIRPLRRHIRDLPAPRINMRDPQARALVQDIIKDDERDSHVRLTTTAQIDHLALLVALGVQRGGQIDHPRQNGLHERVMCQVDGKADAAEEIEDGRGEDAAAVAGEEDAEEYQGCGEVVPVAAHVGVLLDEGGHEVLHDVRPARILVAVHRVAGQEHADNDHEGGNRRGEERRRVVFQFVCQFGDKHAHDNVHALDGAGRDV